jgi:hypothetical protein
MCDWHLRQREYHGTSKRKGKKYGIFNGFCPEREINLGLKIVSKLSLTYWLAV